MMETLAQKRQRFTHDVALLILQAEQLGYKCALDQVKRTQAEAIANAASGAGISNSLHTLGLAVDLLLYKDGKYITDGTGHTELGAWWKSFSDIHSWGGDFKAKDYNHYSLSHNGVR